VIAYKFLRADGTSVFTRFRWPVPGTWVEAPVEPCRSGIHACRAADLPYWAGRQLYVVELDGEIVEHETKVVAPRARLVRRIDAWDDVRDVYTRMCADRGHELAHRATPALTDWEAVIEPSIPEGPALLGFVAARIAEQLSGPAAYREERARQTAWLVERLGLAG
jgi:hypothetical protein